MASPPIQEAVQLQLAEATIEELAIVEPPTIAYVHIIEVDTSAPVQKRLAVYNAEMWDYPYKDWTVQQIPEGEAWEGWYATTSTGKVIVEWAYSTSLIYGGLEQSADMKEWYRTFCIDHYRVDQYNDETKVRTQKASFPLIVNPVTGEVGRQFFRLNFPWVDDLTGVQTQ